MPKKQASYEEAMNELQQIVADIENENISVDDLADKIKRATELIEYCQNKLRSTEQDISQTLEKLSD